MKSYKRFKNKLLKDKEVKKNYEALKERGEKTIVFCANSLNPVDKKLTVC